MKKIISGRMYNTETATLVAEWSNACGVRDFNYCAETLYRKRGGEYFLHGKGGAASKYARSSGQNVWSGGEQIIPLSYDNACQWAEEHLDADEYEAEFGEVPEDEGEVVPISVRVSPAAKTALDRLAAKTGRSKGELVSEAILALQ